MLMQKTGMNKNLSLLVSHGATMCPREGGELFSACVGCAVSFRPVPVGHIAGELFSEIQKREI